MNPSKKQITRKAAAGKFSHSASERRDGLSVKKATRIIVKQYGDALYSLKDK